MSISLHQNKENKGGYNLLISLLSIIMIFVFVYLSINVFPPAILYAGEEAGVKTPISINSENMTMSNIDNKLIFEGSVVMVKEDLTLNANKIIVTFKNSSKDKANLFQSTSEKNKNDISLIEASGNVRIVQSEKKAKSDNAIYYQDEEKIILTGSPEAWEQGYKVTGKKIIIYLKENRSIVDESHVIIYPK